jgi:hypothetical protein
VAATGRPQTADRAALLPLLCFCLSNTISNSGCLCLLCLLSFVALYFIFAFIWQEERGARTRTAVSSQQPAASSQQPQPQPTATATATAVQCTVAVGSCAPGCKMPGQQALPRGEDLTVRSWGGGGPNSFFGLHNRRSRRRRRRPKNKNKLNKSVPTTTTDNGEVSPRRPAAAPCRRFPTPAPPRVRPTPAERLSAPCPKRHTKRETQTGPQNNALPFVLSCQTACCWPLPGAAVLVPLYASHGRAACTPPGLVLSLTR